MQNTTPLMKYAWWMLTFKVLVQAVISISSCSFAWVLKKWPLFSQNPNVKMTLWFAAVTTVCSLQSHLVLYPASQRHCCPQAVVQTGLSWTLKIFPSLIQQLLVFSSYVQQCSFLLQLWFREFFKSSLFAFSVCSYFSSPFSKGLRVCCLPLCSWTGLAQASHQCELTVLWPF